MDSLRPALEWPLQFCTFVTGSTYVVSILTSNVSQVDRLWTILPTIYTTYFALLPLWHQTPKYFLIPFTPPALGREAINDYSPRALLMLALVFIWMCRLSYNTWRRGLFSLGDEDYRWSVLRAKVPLWFFQVVNVTFIAIIQNILLLSLGLPTAVASVLQPHDPLTTSDFTLAVLAIVILAVEFTADNQQFAFQAYKHALLAKEKGTTSVKPYRGNQHWPGARLAWTPTDARRGFITRGLWAYSRHPNFYCEQTFWWIVNLMPLLAAPPPHIPHISVSQLARAYPDQLKSLVASLYPNILYIVPAASLSLLFYSSTLFTEGISKSKYPEAYVAYQKRVPMFDPSKSLWKLVVHRLFRSEVERKKIDDLVWGNAHSTKKSQ